MIQNLMSYSENNPQLTSKLLSMLKREQTPTDTVSLHTPSFPGRLSLMEQEYENSSFLIPSNLLERIGLVMCIHTLTHLSITHPQALTSPHTYTPTRPLTPTHSQSDSTKNAFEMLEQKLLQAQELQSRQAQEHFRTQEQFQQAIQKKLEEQAEQQLKVLATPY